MFSRINNRKTAVGVTTEGTIKGTIVGGVAFLEGTTEGGATVGRTTSGAIE